jgi:hypothetical protein
MCALGLNRFLHQVLHFPEHCWRAIPEIISYKEELLDVSDVRKVVDLKVRKMVVACGFYE